MSLVLQDSLLVLRRPDGVPWAWALALSVWLVFRLLVWSPSPFHLSGTGSLRVLGGMPPCCSDAGFAVDRFSLETWDSILEARLGDEQDVLGGDLNDGGGILDGGVALAVSFKVFGSPVPEDGT